MKPTYYGHGPKYWGSWLLLALFSLLIFIAALDFSQFFVLFHKVFFPGKTNWVFYPSEDEIINVLPEEFFRNCAIVIALSLVIICVVNIIKDKKVETA